MQVVDDVIKRTKVGKINIDVFFGNLLDKAIICANFFGRVSYKRRNK